MSLYVSDGVYESKVDRELKTPQSVSTEFISYLHKHCRSKFEALKLFVLSGGSLDDLLKFRREYGLGGLPDDKIAHYTWQILSGLVYLHDNNLLHKVAPHIHHFSRVSNLSEAAREQIRAGDRVICKERKK
jgi:serine/threonine protein kinase